MKLIVNIFHLLRLNSWLKNTFLFFPLVFSNNLLNFSLFRIALLAFITFSFASSIVYIINDLIDIQKDKFHPRKKNRPLPSGKITPKLAYIILGILFILLFSFIQNFSVKFLWFTVSYIILNLLYTIVLKKLNLIESFIISFNFSLRIFAGCAAIGVLASEWIIVVTVSVSLFMIFIKRKSELLILKENAVMHREVLKYYNVSMLDKFIYITATITITSYMLYTINETVAKTFGTDNLIYTSIFVIIGIFRFIQLSECDIYDNEGDPTTLIIRDHYLKYILLMWILSVILIIYII